MWKNEYYFGNFFVELFKQLKRQEDLIKVEEVTIFYETSNIEARIYDTTKIAFERANKELFVLQTKMYLGMEEIEKIIMIQHYSVRYWADNDNQSLSPLNSFIFHYEKTKKFQEFKVPLFLVPIE